MTYLFFKFSNINKDKIKEIDKRYKIKILPFAIIKKLSIVKKNKQVIF